jgi:hypothetical protein
MPEPYWPKRKNSYRISDALKNNKFARLQCRYCKTERHFLLEELRIVFGNVEVDEMAYQRDWRCSNCGKISTIELKLCDPNPDQLRNITIRKIDRIEYVRKITWKDE